MAEATTAVGEGGATDAMSEATMIVKEEVVTDHAFLCRRCRKALFLESELVPHDNTQGARGHKQFKGQRGMQVVSDEPAVCTSYFLDPDVSPWVACESRALHAEAQAAKLELASNPYAQNDATNASSSALTVVDPDTIYCFHCHAKIGAQSWVGSQCSCGAWVTPAFKIHAKAVDRTPVVVVEEKRVARVTQWVVDSVAATAAAPGESD